MRTDQPDEQHETDATWPERAEDGAAMEGESAGVTDSPIAADASGLQARMDAMQDRYLRLAAEYDNYRKRTDRERAEAYDRAQAQLVKQLLDSLDDLQRVAHHAHSTSVEALLEGVQLVERKMLRALENAGLELLDAHGRPFDPEIHEALMAAATEDLAEDDSVGEVFQNGYRFKGELLRPARVAVRKFGTGA